MAKKQIAFFDFDGTLTQKDSLLSFIQFSRGIAMFYIGFALNSPFLVAYKLKIISNQAAKERVLRFFFGGMSENSFLEQCNRFSRECLPGLIRPKALIEIEKHKNAGTRVVIVSASPETWISPWAGAAGLELIASIPEIKEGRVTGKLIGKNCYGTEKVDRIQQRYRLPEYDCIYTYGDSSGDRPMLSLGNYRFWKPFR